MYLLLCLDVRARVSGNRATWNRSWSRTRGPIARASEPSGALVRKRTVRARIEAALPAFRRLLRRRNDFDASANAAFATPATAPPHPPSLDQMQCFGVDLYKDETRGGTYSIADQVARFLSLIHI